MSALQGWLRQQLPRYPQISRLRPTRHGQPKSLIRKHIHVHTYTIRRNLGSGGDGWKQKVRAADFVAGGSYRGRRSEDIVDQSSTRRTERSLPAPCLHAFDKGRDEALSYSPDSRSSWSGLRKGAFGHRLQRTLHRAHLSWLTRTDSD